jgi:hypothetical protein
MPLTDRIEAVLSGGFLPLEGSASTQFGSLGYDDNAVWDVIAYPGPSEFAPCAEAIRLEASFRRASAHAQFGDENLLRGLNAAFNAAPQLRDPLLNSSTALSQPLTNQIDVGLLRLDSRLCAHSDFSDSPCGEPGDCGHAPPYGQCRFSGEKNGEFCAVPDGLFGLDADWFSTSLCSTDADCTAPDFPTCRAALVSRETLQNGKKLTNQAFGAVQEYRLAEASLVNAMRELGVDRFRSLDQVQGGCPGGCAARLLVHIGAMKLRAQFERIDRLWRRALATADTSADAPKCDSPADTRGQSCGLDRDCSTSAKVGRCGQNDRQRSFVRFQEAVGEALAEAAAAQSVYGTYLPEPARSANPDVAAIRSFLSDITAAAERSASGYTPFGLPQDYVPILTDIQKKFIGCYESCNPTCPNASLVFDCIGRLAVGDVQAVLNSAKATQDMASYDANEYVMQLKETPQQVNAAKAEFRRTILRLLGDPEKTDNCPPEYDRIDACFTAPAFQGDLGGATWIIHGAVCDDKSDHCSTEGVDGEFEIQVQAVRLAQLSLENIEAQINDNRDHLQETAELYRTLTASDEQACDQTVAIRKSAGNSIRSAYDGAIYQAKKRQEESSILGGFFSFMKAIVTLNPAGAVEGVQQLASANSGNAEIGGLQLQQETAEINNESEIHITQVQCLTNLQKEQAQGNDALFGVELQGRDLIRTARSQRLAIVSAESEMNKLMSELRQAQESYQSTKALDDIWRKQEFRNVQNYRLLALTNQLRAADKFRLAQLVTWLALRASSYDLVKPDVLEPQTLKGLGQSGPFPDDPLRKISCNHKACVGHPEISCTMGGTECGTGGTCGSSALNGAKGDSCSLQAVFAAQTVGDLKDLIAGAYAENVYTSGRRVVCNPCRKTIQLKRILTDYTSPPADGTDAYPPLGTTLRNRPLASSDPSDSTKQILRASVNFSVSLDRKFQVCREIEPGGKQRCEPNATAGLGNDGSGPGFGDDRAIWGARLVYAFGLYHYVAGHDPGALLCRRLDDYSVVERPNACSLVTPGTVCLKDTNGSTLATCRQLFTGSAPVARLYQLGPGLLRSRLAKREGPDLVLPYRLFDGDLPLSKVDECGRDQAHPCSIPQLRSLNFPLRLYQSVAEADRLLKEGGENGPVTDLKGVPVATPNWQLRMESDDLIDESNEKMFREFLASIDDIEIVFGYQGYDLPQ